MTRKQMTILVVAFLVVAFIAITLIILTGVRTNLQINYAYITLNSGKTIEVEVDMWSEYDGAVTIKAKDGNIYGVSRMNCTLSKNRLE